MTIRFLPSTVSVDSAFDILRQRIASRGGQPGIEDSITRVEYQPRLIVRGSTGAVRDSSK